MENNKVPRREGPPPASKKEGLRAAIEIVDVNDLIIHKKHKDERQRPTENPRAPGPDRPGEGDMPLWDPEQERDWRRQDEEEKKGPPRGVAYL